MWHSRYLLQPCYLCKECLWLRDQNWCSDWPVTRSATTTGTTPASVLRHYRLSHWFLWFFGNHARQHMVSILCWLHWLHIERKGSWQSPPSTYSFTIHDCLFISSSSSSSSHRLGLLVDSFQFIWCYTTSELEMGSLNNLRIDENESKSYLMIFNSLFLICGEVVLEVLNQSGVWIF